MLFTAHLTVESPFSGRRIIIIILHKSVNKCVYILFVLLRTGLRMMCSRCLGILLKEESYIFLDLVHQKKKTTMLFVRLERLAVFYIYLLSLCLVSFSSSENVYRPFPRDTVTVCFYNERTVISDKIGFIVSLILISVAHLYLNCTIVHPLAVFIKRDVAL